MRAAAISLACLALVGGTPATRPAPRRVVIAVLDFAPGKGEAAEMAGRIGEAIWMKLERIDDVVLIDRLSARQALAAAEVAVDAQTSPGLLAKVGKDLLGAQVVVWGTVDREGADRFTIRARALDLTGPEPDLYVNADFPANGYREVPFAVQRIVNAVRRDALALDPAIDPRDPGPQPPDPAVLARPNLVRNGDFEQGDKAPVAWEPVDGLASFWVPAPDRPGKCIMFDTDVKASQWTDWHKKFTLGTSNPPPAPIRGTGPKYDTIGGTYGAWLYSDFIPVEPGRRYRLAFDFRSTSAGGKVFVKGYAAFEDQRREVYRMQKNCRIETAGRQWEHFTCAFHPTDRTPRVRWLRVELFGYWPPTRYYFDNVHLSLEPAER